MSNCCHDCCEHGASMITGVFTEGIYSAGDITIAVHQVVVDGRSGYTITIESPDGTQELTLLDGVSADLTEINDMLDALRRAQAEWQQAERDRAAAEEARVAAEGNPDDPEDKDPSTRWGLYRLLLELQARLEALLSEQQAQLDAAREAAAAAQAAADRALEIEASLVDDLIGALKDRMFIKDGDIIRFKREPASNDTTDHYITDEVESKGLNAGGYVTEDRTLIHIKIPIGKFLTYVTGVTINKFTAYIHNSGGYGLRSGFSTEGDDYLSLITSIGVDKVQNCIHLMIHKPSRFILTNNMPVSCRGVDIEIVFECNANATPEGSDTE